MELKKGIAETKGKKSRSLAVAREAELLRDIRTLIESTRNTIARSINSAQVLLFWDIGDRTYRVILDKKRARYGEEIVSTLSAQLQHESLLRARNLLETRADDDAAQRRKGRE